MYLLLPLLLGEREREREGVTTQLGNDLIKRDVLLEASAYKVPHLTRRESFHWPTKPLKKT